MITTSTSHGLWARIVAATPRPEVEELGSIIGKRVIDTNESLYCELAALKEIVADILTFESGNMTLLRSSEDSPERAMANRHRKQNKAFSGRADECDSDTESALNNNDDFINGIEHCLSVSKIHEVLSIVRDAFAREREELEAEISLLQTTMDTESEIISRGNTPRGDKVSESFGSSNLQLDHTYSSSPIRGSSHKMIGHDHANLVESASSQVHKSVVVMGPGRIRRSDSSNNTMYAKKSNGSSTGGPLDQAHNLSQSLNLKLSELAMKPSTESSSGQSIVTVQQSIIDSSSPSYSRSNSGNGNKISRMRSRIETARDERFFMDDDIFFN